MAGTQRIALVERETREVGAREAREISVRASHDGERTLQRAMRVLAHSAARLVRQESAPAEVVVDLDTLAPLHVGIVLEPAQDVERCARVAERLHLDREGGARVALEARQSEDVRTTLGVPQQRTRSAAVTGLGGEDFPVIRVARSALGIAREILRYGVERRPRLVVPMAPLMESKRKRERVVDRVGDAAPERDLLAARIGRGLAPACGKGAQPAVGRVMPLPLHIKIIGATVGCDVCGLVADGTLYAVFPADRVAIEQFEVTIANGSKASFQNRARPRACAQHSAAGVPGRRELRRGARRDPLIG